MADSRASATVVTRIAEAVRQLLRVIPAAVGVVRQVVQVLQVQAVRGQAEPGRLGAQHALVRGRAGLGQVPALQL